MCLFRASSLFSRYGRVPCLEDSFNNLNKPNALGVRSVAGVFIMLGCGLLAAVLLLFLEHLVFRYFLPKLRLSSKRSAWKSPNLMFFSQVRRNRNMSSLETIICTSPSSVLTKLCPFTKTFNTIDSLPFSFLLWQKLYRFVNTVELVSPHHSAKEIIASLKEGQITSLFQKSLKRVRLCLCSSFSETWLTVGQSIYFVWFLLFLSVPNLLSLFFSYLPLSLTCCRKQKKKHVVGKASRNSLKWFRRFEKCEYPPAECHPFISFPIYFTEYLKNFFLQLLLFYFYSVREQQDERRVIGEESIVVTISNPSKRPASACNSLESVPRKRKDDYEEPERIPSVLRWKEPASPPSDPVLFEPDFTRSPPATSSLKPTCRLSPTNTGTAPVPVSLTSPSSPSSSSLHSPTPPIELIPVVKRHQHHYGRQMRARSISVDSFRSFIHGKCASESRIQDGDGNVISGKEEKKKSWSFDDLTNIRQSSDADEFKSDHQKGGRLAHILIPGNASSDPRSRSPSVIIMSSPRHFSCESAIDPVKLRMMRKETIITLWKSSERQLRNSLQDILQEKRALEQKLLVLQQMLLKPPWKPGLVIEDRSSRTKN